jgi:thiosulfate reductase cytochrome b subunit
MRGEAPDQAIDAAQPGHPVWVRLCHWLLAASVLVLAFSGVVILLAHPRLYWGNTGNDLTPAWIELPLGRNYHHGGWGPALAFTADPSGPVSRVRTYDIFNQNGWARSLHFLTAWLFVAALLAYLALGVLTGHLRRDVVPQRRELAPRLLWRDLLAHLRLTQPAAPGGPPYGLLQKSAYAAVALIGLPGLVLSGLAQSPAVGAGWPVLPALFGGSQSARSIHFLLLVALTLFLIAHLVMVALTGPGRQLLAMTWGRRHGR